MMRKAPKKTLVTVGAMLVLSMLSGCLDKNDSASSSATPAPSASTATTTPATAAKVTPENAQDSSDLPTWTGKQLKLSVWYGHGTGDQMDARKFDKDVVNPEIARVTGVTIDREKSFDNAGSSFEVKMGLLAASNNWPSMVTNANSLKQLADSGKIYDLTDLLPKYAPNLMRKVPKTLSGIWDSPTVNGGVKGKIYSFPLKISENTLLITDPQIDKNKFPGASPNVFIYVRDDIVKKLYPSAKSEKEIEDLYMKNGKFTKEDLLDVPINSVDDFRKMLVDIKALDLKEGNQSVSPTFLYSGQDNWALMSMLYGGLLGAGKDFNYFSYWDRAAQKVQWGFEQPWFKDMALNSNKLMRDGLVSKEAMVDPFNTFTQKLNNGLYAVSYASWLVPQQSLLEKAGKTYKYRKVYLNIPFKSDQFVSPQAPVSADWQLSIFKDKVSEEDLPQVLKYLDFLASDAGEKLWQWGPRSAGLFDEVNGKRVFKDKELEAEMVYNKAGTVAQSYNLQNGTTGAGEITAFNFMPRGKFSPAKTYDLVRTPSEADTYFDMGRVEPYKQADSKNPDIWNFFGTVADADKAWKARVGIESALTKVLVAKSDDEFNKLWNDFITLAGKSGYNADLIQKLDAQFRIDNADKMANLK